MICCHLLRLKEGKKQKREKENPPEVLLHTCKKGLAHSLVRMNEMGHVFVFSG